MRKKIKKGFTLVELVIVIAVIAVLSAILIPTFGNILGNSKISKMKVNLRTMTSKLITDAALNGIPYFAPADVRILLDAYGFDLDEVPSGYTIWYDQYTMNLSLLKDSEVFAPLKTYKAPLSQTIAAISPMTAKASVASITSTSSSISRTSTSGYDTDMIENLPYRPEALTEDKNLTMISSSNNAINNYVDNIYNFSSKSQSAGETGRAKAAKIVEYIKNTIFDVTASLGLSDEWAEQLIKNFNLESTAFIDEDGNLVTMAVDNGIIDNLLIDKNADKFSGITGNNASYNLTFNCVFEVSSNITDIDESFFTNVVQANSSIVLVVSSTLSSSAAIATSAANVGINVVSTNIAAIITGSTSTSSGNTSVAYKSITDGLDGLYSITYASYAQMYGNGSIESNKKLEVTGDDLANLFASSTDSAGNKLMAKWVIPKFNIDLTKPFTVGADTFTLGSFANIESLTIKETSYGDLRKITIVFTSTIGGTIRGFKVDDGIGYITNIYDYITESSMFENDGSNWNCQGAIALPVIKINLPTGRTILDNFKDQTKLVVTAYYKEQVNSYSQQLSAFGEVFYQPIASVVVGETKSKTLDFSNGSTWLSSVDSFHEVDLSSFDYCTRSVQLERVEIKNISGQILFVRYY